HGLEAGSEGLGEHPLDHAFEVAFELVQDPQVVRLQGRRSRGVHGLYPAGLLPPSGAKARHALSTESPQRGLLPSRGPPRASGGIGRRAGFRFLWGQPRGGSSPLSPTTLSRPKPTGLGSVSLANPLDRPVW